MSKRTETRLIREGRYVAEVQVEFEGDGVDPNPPALDAEHPILAEVREALRRGDLSRAQRYGQVYELPGPGSRW